MRVAVIRFPGSNCDEDAYHAVHEVLGEEAVFVWHREHDLQGADAVIIPGGFSYGDYLRSGAIAALSPVMESVHAFAASGRPVLGICNGFQILTETGLLPGQLARNRGLHFVCRSVHVRVERSAPPFTSGYERGQVLKLPVAHNEGAYYAAAETLARLEARDQIVFRYCSAEGVAEDAANPNGSLSNIAGIVNEAGNVLGMMPHPERASEELLGSSDGLPLFKSLLHWAWAHREVIA